MKNKSQKGYDLEIEYITNYRKSVEENKNKSQDDFEKYINIMASGGLVISLMFIEKLVENKIIIISSWLFILGLIGFVCTLLINLISHNKSINDSSYILDNIGFDINKFEDKNFLNEISKRNNKIDLLNKVSIGSLITGVFAILIFFTINFLNMSNQEPKPKPQPQQNPPMPLTEEKGRTNPTPARVTIPTPKK